MDGVELTRAIRALDPAAAVIWITAYGSHEMRGETVRLAVYDCLDKPLEIAEIRQVVREALEATEGRKPKTRKEIKHGQYSAYCGSGVDR